MILEEETFKQFGYYPSDLSTKSDKRIIVSCDECGKIREVNKEAYRSLCHQCAILKQSQFLTEKDKAINEKMIGILENETFNKFGYYPSKLKTRSSKRILAKCIECGKVREISKSYYRDLCGSCMQKGERSYWSGKHHSDDTKKKMSEWHIGKKVSYETRKKMCQPKTEETKEKLRNIRLKLIRNGDVIVLRGENHPSWRGGLSFQPYCEKFDNGLKERVREFFNRKCYLCDKTETENGEKLCVHHVNYDKMVCCNDITPLFVPLCRSCHSKTNLERAEWQEFFEISLDYLTDNKCFYSKEEMKKL